MKNIQTFSAWLMESREEAKETLKLHSLGLIDSFPHIQFSVIDKREVVLTDGWLGKISFNLAWPNSDSSYDYTLYTTSFLDKGEADWKRRELYYGIISKEDLTEWIWAHLGEVVEKYAPGTDPNVFQIATCLDTGETRTLDGEEVHP